MLKEKIKMFFFFYICLFKMLILFPTLCLQQIITTMFLVSLSQLNE